jgi:hypothetical protein
MIGHGIAALVLTLAWAQDPDPGEDPYSADGGQRGSETGAAVTAAGRGDGATGSAAAATPASSCVDGPATRPEPGFGGFGAFVEQDLFFPPRNSDRNYTMGVGLQASGAWVLASRLDWPLRIFDCLVGVAGWHTALATRFGLTAEGERPFLESHSLTYGVTAFTPDDLRSSAPIHDDRPYASLMFLSVARATINPHPASRLVLKSELSLGVLGLRLAEKVQTAIHRGLRGPDDPPDVSPPDPRGWHNQISDGLEPTLKYTVAALKALSESNWHDLAALGEASAGYYTNAAVGATLRAGRIRSNFWTFSSNPLTLGNQGTVESRVLDRDRRKFELFAFGGSRARLVLYNALMQGQFRKSEVRLVGAQLERFVHEFEAGIGGGMCGLTFSYVIVGGRSPEHHAGATRSHYWGGLYLTYNGPLDNRQSCL